MGVNLIFASALALAAPAPSRQWAPVGLTDSDVTTVYFVDRTRIETTADGSNAWVYAVSPKVALSLHLQYDCRQRRYRALEASLPAGETPKPGQPIASRWGDVREGTPLDAAMRYVCSGAKLDMGFGDLAVPFATPVEFAREFISRRAAARKERPAPAH